MTPWGFFMLQKEQAKANKPELPKPANAPKPESNQAHEKHLKQWTGLNDCLMAHIRECDREGNDIKGGLSVLAPVTEAELQLENNWQSPFENSSAETRAPNLLGLLLSGEATKQFGAIAEAKLSADPNAAVVDKILGSVVGGVTSAIGRVAEALDFKETMQFLEGRTSMSKVNSTQVFVGASPAKISMTLFFHALEDAGKEVEEPLRRLMMMAVPAFLADESGVTKLLAGTVANAPNPLSAFFSGMAPPLLKITFGGRTYGPLHLEPITVPMSGPMDAKGNRISCSVSTTFTSRQTWDSGDISKLFGKR